MSREPTALARADGARNVRELLAFELANEHYALPLALVREIMRVPPITEVPRAPDAVLGVISARGVVTTLVDLRRRLRLPARPFDTRTRVLLVKHGDETLGLVVDAVREVQRLAPEEIELAGVLGSSASPHLFGIGRPARRAGAPEILLLLDAEPLLALDRSLVR